MLTCERCNYLRLNIFFVRFVFLLLCFLFPVDLRLFFSLFLFFFTLLIDSRLQCFPIILAIVEVVSSLYFSIVFIIFSVKTLLFSLFSIKISSISSSVKLTSFIILFNNFTVFLFFVFAYLNSRSAIAISGAVDEFVIVIVEFPFIANDPVALLLNL